MRAELDDSASGCRRRSAPTPTQKVPFVLIAGGRTWTAGTVSFRFRDGTQENGVPIEDAIARIREAIDTHAQV